MSKFDRFERAPFPKRLEATLTRPADTTAYAAGDIIADSTSAPTVQSFVNAALADGRGGVIRNVTLIDSNNATIAGDFELWLMNLTYTATNDNAAFAPTDAQAASVELILSLPGSGSIIGNAGAAAAGNRVYQALEINKDFRCDAADKDLYWALIARNAYVPVSGEAFTLKIDILQR